MEYRYCARWSCSRLMGERSRSKNAADTVVGPRGRDHWSVGQCWSQRLTVSGCWIKVVCGRTARSSAGAHAARCERDGRGCPGSGCCRGAETASPDQPGRRDLQYLVFAHRGFCHFALRDSRRLLYLYDQLTTYLLRGVLRDREEQIAVAVDRVAQPPDSDDMRRLRESLLRGPTSDMRGLELTSRSRRIQPFGCTPTQPRSSTHTGRSRWSTQFGRSCFQSMNWPKRGSRVSYVNYR